MTVHSSFCRYCTNGCPILVDVEDGRALRVRGNDNNSVYAGYTCVKGRALPTEHARPDRLLWSQRRTVAGAYEPISSERLMDEVADALRRIIETHGPDAVAFYSGTKAAAHPTTGVFCGSLAAQIGSSMRFTSDTLDQPGKQVAKGFHGVWMAGPQGFDRPQVGLVIGANPMVSYVGGLPMGNPGERLKRWTEAGFQLIVIDPRRTEFAHRATVHLQPRPGEDVGILAAIIRVILTEGLQDHQFLAAEVDGLEDLRARVDPFTPEMVAQRADIDAADLVRAARIFASAKRGYAVASTGPNMAGPGSLVEYLVLSLNTICGRWLRAGEQVPSPFTLAPEFFPAVAQAIPPFPSHGLGEALPHSGLRASLGGLPTAVLPREILAKNVRALISVGGNPVAAWPDQVQTVEAMKALDLLVQIDIRMSATAKLADYVVAPKMSLEMPSCTSLLDMTALYGAAYTGYAEPWAQWSDAVVDPPAGSDLLAEWEFLYGLGQRLGLQLELGAPFDFIPSPKTPVDMTTKPTTEDLLYLLTQGSRIPLDEVRKHPGGAVFAEPSKLVAPKSADCTARLDVGNALMMADLTAVANSASAAPAAPFPLRLISRRMQHAYNSSIPDTKVSRSRPYNPAFMNPADLAELGLNEGDHVEIRSRSGSIPGIVRADHTLRRGVVSMSHAFGDVPERDQDFDRIGSTTGRLLDIDYLQPYTGQPLMSNVPVAVQLVEPAPSPAVAGDRTRVASPI